MKHCILLLIINLSLFSCVGTVKNANSDTTKSNSTTDSKVLEYNGISTANAIANDKVEITFPQSSLDSDNVAYVINYDGLQVPIYVYGTSLTPDYRGALRYTVTGLNINTTYSFSVQIRNVSTNIESNNTTYKIAKTFSNKTADFMGISELRNVSGAAGTTSLQIFWNQATKKGTTTKSDEIDPIEYDVTLIDSTVLNPGNMNDSSFTTPFRRVITVSNDQRTTIISGLTAGRKYYAQVRAVHYGYTANSGDSNYKLETNTKYLAISTYTDDLANIDFDDSTFELTLPSGSGGLYALSSTWEAPAGNFDHYRLYYAVKGDADVLNYLNTENADAICSGVETTNSKIYCDSFASNSNTNNIISGLDNNTTYDVVLAICVSTKCELGKRVISSVHSKTTTPNVASFSGISSIEAVKSLETLNEATLNFDLPNFLTGNINGYLVYYYGNDPTNASPFVINDPDSTNTTSLTVLPYNVYSDTSIVIKGLEPLSGEQYCFMMVPYSYKYDGSKVLGNTDNLSPVCITPTVRAPKATEFTGLEINNSLCNTISKSVYLKWSAPTAGIYSNYEIFYTSGGIFSFDQAINWETSGYKRIFLNSGITDYTLMNLAPGTTYKFAILTYFASITVPYRSEYNSNIFECSL